MSEYPDYSSDISWFRDELKRLQREIDENNRGRVNVVGWKTGDYKYVAGRKVEAGWLPTDGTLRAAASYPDLEAYLREKVGTVTVAVGANANITIANHGFVPGDRVYFTTSGALPTGLSSWTVYYVIAAGLTSSRFRVATTDGGTAVTTSGTQSGVHSVVYAPYETGSVSQVNFRLPDTGEVVVAGVKTGSAMLGTIGSKYGAATHTLTVAEIPAHKHGSDSTQPWLQSNQTAGSSSTGNSAAITRYSFETALTGGGGAHNNMQPTIAALICIKT